nr:zinc finger, CCHC-type, retrotransposon Gag domain protein [Tanacetum cinerariifolium]
MCMSYTDVAQVANAVRNYVILHERDDDDTERPDKRGVVIGISRPLNKVVTGATVIITTVMDLTGVVVVITTVAAAATTTTTTLAPTSQQSSHRNHGHNNYRHGSDRRGGSDNHRSSNNNYSGSNNRSSGNGRDQRNRGQQSNRYANSGSQQSRGPSEGYSYPVCTTCRRRHPGECHRAAGTCFKCGQAGHLQKDCKKDTTAST